MNWILSRDCISLKASYVTSEKRTHIFNLIFSALHIAAFYGQGSLIDILAKHGCLTDATDFLGCTPLHLASQKGYQNIIVSAVECHKVIHAFILPFLPN